MRGQYRGHDMDHSTRPNKQVVSPLPGEHDVTITKIFQPEELDMAAAVEALYMLLREPSVVQPIDAHPSFQRQVGSDAAAPTPGSSQLLSKHGRVSNVSRSA